MPNNFSVSSFSNELTGCAQAALFDPNNAVTSSAMPDAEQASPRPTMRKTQLAMDTAQYVSSQFPPTLPLQLDHNEAAADGMQPDSGADAKSPYALNRQERREIVRLQKRIDAVQIPANKHKKKIERKAQAEISELKVKIILTQEQLEQRQQDATRNLRQDIQELQDSIDQLLQSSASKGYTPPLFDLKINLYKDGIERLRCDIDKRNKKIAKRYVGQISCLNDQIAAVQHQAQKRLDAIDRKIKPKVYWYQGQIAAIKYQAEQRQQLPNIDSNLEARKIISVLSGYLAKVKQQQEQVEHELRKPIYTLKGAIAYERYLGLLDKADESHHPCTARANSKVLKQVLKNPLAWVETGPSLDELESALAGVQLIAEQRKKAIAARELAPICWLGGNLTALRLFRKLRQHPNPLQAQAELALLQVAVTIDLGQLEHVNAATNFDDALVFDQAGTKLKGVWITLHPHGPDNEAQRVLIDPDTKKIIKGLGDKFNGMTIQEMINANRAKGARVTEHQLPQELKVNRDPITTQQAQSSYPQHVTRAKASAQPHPRTTALKQGLSARTQVSQDLIQAMAQACALPQDSIIAGLDLSHIKGLYRSGQPIAGNCTPEELRALVLGPQSYANSDLKNRPRIEFSELKAQAAFNRLDAEVTAGRTLLKLHQAGELHLSERKLQRIAQLERQLHHAQQIYVQHTYPQLMHDLTNGLAQVQAKLGLNSRQELLAQGAQLVAQNLVAKYQRGEQIAYPWIKFVLTQPSFTCSNRYVEAWLHAASLQAMLATHKDDLRAKLGAKAYQDAVDSATQRLRQAQQMVEIKEGCSLHAALDREFHRHYLRTDPLMENHALKPEAISEAPSGPDMTFKQADQKRPNPHYEERLPKGAHIQDYPYNTNCQASVVAYEVRRRGFDVEARPYLELDEAAYNKRLQELEPMLRLAACNQSIWYNPATGAAPDVTYLAEQNSKLSPSNLPSKLEMQLDAMIKPGQRFHLAFQWKDNGGHVVTVEKGADGKLFLYDPQTGLHGSVSAYFSPKRNPQARDITLRSLRTYRVDICEIITNFANLVLTKAGSPAVTTKQALTHDWSKPMVQYHGVDYDDDIPEIVARRCSSSVEYYGVFKNWDAYRICGRFKSPLLEGLTPLTGYPQYMLVARDGSGDYCFYNDREFEITHATQKQVEQLRREGHKKRS